jgi:lipoprotein-anchoring transpeptidase ErfK/SrfK
MADAARFFSRGFAIHGIRALSRVGSHGCVRLTPSHAAALFSLVERKGAAPYADPDLE